MMDLRRALIVVAVLLGVMFGLPGAGAVREAAAQITVTAADPATADQGTISLPVTIKGNGFKKGAKAKFYVTGTSDPGGITVSSTRFVSSTQLTATIDVAATAVVAGFDIAVTNADGRTGKGTELFSVTAKRLPYPDVIPVSVTLLDTSDEAGTPSTIRAEGDSEAPYPANLNPYVRDDGTNYWILSWSTVLSSRTSYESQRSVVFEFEPRTYNGDGTVSCYPTAMTLDPQDAAKGPYFFKTPEFLSAYPAIPDGNQKPVNILVNTGYEWKQDLTGLWVQTSQRFDVGQYFNSPATAPATAVVEFMIVFKTPELDAAVSGGAAQAIIAHNGPRAFVKSVGNTWGLAEVLKVDGGFEIRPLGLEALSNGLADTYPRPDGYQLDPLPAYQPSTEPGYANLSLTVPLARKLGYKALNAVCDLGAFWMPFRARVTK